MKKLFTLIVLLVAPASYADVVVIGHPSNNNQLNKDDVSKIFLGKKSSFPDGSKATPFYLDAGDSVRATFDKDVLGKSSTQLKSYWSKLVFTGKGTPPKELGSTGEAVSTVAGDASAVAYVSSGEVTDAVKVLYKP